MIEYTVRNFNEFYNCMQHLEPVYIQKIKENYPIPDMYGVFYPFMKENRIAIAVFAYDKNEHIPYDEYEKMIITKEFRDDAGVVIFTMDDILDPFMNAQKDFKLVVMKKYN